MAENTRERILDLAVASIDAGGEASLRVTSIITAAQITPPTLYHHFGSREGLVIAAQIERYTRQTRFDIDVIGKAVAECESADDLRATLVGIWRRSLAERAESRWRRTSVVGSAYGRPELEAAVAEAQDWIVEALAEILEPCRERGWLRPGIDLVSTIAWHHSVLIGRVHIEHGVQRVDPEEWDRLTISALEAAFFGP